MSRTLATSLGGAALLVMSLLIGSDVESSLGGRAIPQPIAMLMFFVSVLLGNAYLTYRIVRGRRPEPAYTKKEMRKMIKEAVGEQMRAEIETAVARAAIFGAANGQHMSRPNVVKMSREGE